MVSGPIESEGPLRIALFYAWGNANAGDKALALGTVESLHKCFPQASFQVVSMYGQGHKDVDISRGYVTSGDAQVCVIPDDLSSVQKWPRSRVLRMLDASLLPLGVLCPPLLRFLRRKSAVFAAIENADLVLLNGGHLLFWSNRMGQKRRIVTKYLLPLLMAKRLGKAYGLHAQSYGPFEFSGRDRVFRRLFRRVLLGANYLSVRESASLSHLGVCLGSTDRIRRVLDSAFFLNTRDDEAAASILKEHGLTSNRFLALTVRLSKRGSQADLPSESYADYASKMAECLTLWTEKTTMPIVFVCQVPKDVEDSRSIVSRLPDAAQKQCVVLEHNASPEQLIALYAHATALVGMRFHSLIFALLAHIPVMGVYYYDIGPKIKGLMEDLGFPQYALSLDETDGASLYQSVSELVDQAETLSCALREKVEALKAATLATMTDQIGGGKGRISVSTKDERTSHSVSGSRCPDAETVSCARRSDS